MKAVKSMTVTAVPSGMERMEDVLKPCLAQSCEPRTGHATLYKRPRTDAFLPSGRGPMLFSAFESAFVLVYFPMKVLITNSRGEGNKSRRDPVPAAMSRRSL